MVIQKIKAYPAPSYPDKPTVQHDPYILQSIPARWKRNTTAATAAMATVMLLTSACGEERPARTANPTLLPTEHLTPAPTPKPTPVPAVPLFVHGYGRGGFGCVSVNPPVFLSEDEALDVIRQTAEQEGIQFTDTVEMQVKLPALQLEKGEWVADDTTSADGTLLLDGYNEKKQIAYTYVSKEDVIAWDIDTTTGYSFTVYPIIDAAKALAGNVAESGTQMTVAVFYDPVGGSSPISNNGIEQRTVIMGEDGKKESAKESLRQQVLDFIAWLKAEGII